MSPAMRFACLLALAACHTSSPPSTPAPARAPWSEQTFDANVQAKLAERFPGEPITRIDADTFRVSSTEVRITKARAECRADWPACEAAVDHTLDAIGEVKRAGQVTRAQLRVVLRGTAKIAVVSAKLKVTTQPFSSDAQWLLVADLPNVIRLDVTPESLALTADEAWRIALDNSKPVDIVTTSANGVIVYQHDYAPTALRFPALMEETARKLLPGKTGTLLAVCPEENIVLYTIGGAREVAALRQVAESGVKNSQMPLSARVMEWRDGSWRETP